MSTPPPNPRRPSRPRLSELDIMYNPSLGAYLLWRAANGYFAETSRGLPVHLAFLVLPVVLHAQSKKFLEGTRSSSGLTLFAAKLGAQQEDLLALHDRALTLRSLTLASIVMGAMVRILHVSPANAQLFSYEKKPRNPDSTINRLGALSEKLGTWFGRLPVEQVASTLRVAF